MRSIAKKPIGWWTLGGVLATAPLIASSSASFGISWRSSHIDNSWKKRLHQNSNLQRSLSPRGGQTSDPYEQYNNDIDTSNDRVYDPSQPQYPQEVSPDDGFYYPSNNNNDAMDPLEEAETVQQRVERWKEEQREQGKLTEQRIPNKGMENASLLATVSKGSRTIIFFFLMWRDLHLYELADKSLQGAKRVFLVTPLIFLFVGNLLGAATSLTASQSHGTKRRLKAILNADKLVEVCLLFYYFLKLTIFPSRYTPREVYMANVFHSILFLVQCQAFTKVSWDDQNHPPVYKAVDPQRQQEQTGTSIQSNNPYYDGNGNRSPMYESNPRYQR